LVRRVLRPIAEPRLPPDVASTGEAFERHAFAAIRGEVRPDAGRLDILRNDGYLVNVGKDFIGGPRRGWGDGLMVGWRRIMQRIAKIVGAIVFAFGLACTDADANGSWSAGGKGGFSGGGSWSGGGRGWNGRSGSWSGGGWRREGWGPYLSWGGSYDYSDYDWPYDYDYGNGYPSAVSRYCTTRVRACVLHQSRYIGTVCSCKGARGRVSGG
jgi:hypothetical protein